MRTSFRSLESGRTTLWAIGAIAALTLSACSGSTDRLTAPVSSRTSTIASWATNDQGFINVCKASGPAGTYSFAIGVSGGGNYYLGQGPNDHTNPTVNFDGTNLVCTRAYTVVLDDSWTTETTADITITELLPDGVNAAEIRVFDPRVIPSLIQTVFDTPTITLHVGPTDRRKVQYYNVRKPTPPPVIANCVEITIVEGVALTPTQLTASGGNGGPYTFSATGLPAGLSLSSDGVLSGTPTESGTFTYTVTVEDTDGNTGTSGSCSVTVRPPPPPPIVANCVEVVAVQGVALTPTQLTASGGNGGPYTFSATGLPAGLTLSSSGLLSGTPTVSGTFNYTVTVTDSDGNTGTSGTCSVKISPPPPQFCSYTPGGWGAPPNGGNVATIMYANWTTVYGSAGVTLGLSGGSYHNAKWTSPTAVTNYLPNGGTPGIYTTNYVNALTTSALEFGSQVLALRLNVNFSNANIIKPGFATAHVAGGPLGGLTIGQVLNLANSAIGGNTGVLSPYGINVKDFTTILGSINGSFDGCTVNTGYVVR